MNPDVRDGFMSGSGVDPFTLKAVLIVITFGACLAVAVWIIAQLIDAYRNDAIKSAEVVWGVFKTIVLLGLVFVIVSLFR